MTGPLDRARAALKAAVKRHPAAYRLGRSLVEARRRRRQARSWTAPYLSPADKVALLRRYARQHGLGVFVETGTYEGETTQRLSRDFDRLYTVEIDPELARLARMRFGRSPHVTALEGSGPERLREVLADLDRPALFWLDSHPCTTKTSGAGSPAVDELRQVMAHPVPGHVVLVDDVRLLSGTDGWPTLEEVLAVVDGTRFETEVADDVLRVTPLRSG
jgi:hypothetical protein